MKGPRCMTETTTSIKEAIAAPANPRILPCDILLHLVATILAPMFLIDIDGDIKFARMAALETLNAYRARNHMDLIAIAQIIASGLAALGSLSLSMGDDLSLSMILRLRGNAVALNRAAEQNRRVLREPNAGAAPPSKANHDFDEYYAEPAKVTHAATPKSAEQAAPPMQAATPPELPISTAAETMAAQQRQQAIWAAAAGRAGSNATRPVHLQPAERKTTTMRAALNSCASGLLSGNHAASSFRANTEILSHLLKQQGLHPAVSAAITHPARKPA
jgi:hypothetical protein